MQGYPLPLERLILQLQKLPTVGPKTAQRLAFFMLTLPDLETNQIAEAILEVKKNLSDCKICGTITDINPCQICSNPRRDQQIICVVEQPDDLWAIERTESHKGLYHVLGGVLSPLDGVGPDSLRIDTLFNRVHDNVVKEVILATNWDTEGQATALYLTQQLEQFQVTVSRIAYGIPVGGDLEYIDEVTLAKALEGRRAV
ncbi:MAG: recombination mediator RecR [Candidatus Poribacteria bacterium]|nr:recombination mediator RecR [Candidatus Poribacteria bacterium]